MLSSRSPTCSGAPRKTGWWSRSAASTGARRNAATPSLSRFDWCSAECSNPELRRCRSALRFERVRACKCRNVDPAGKEAVLNLLAVEFSEQDPPGGVVTLTFSGGGMLRLEVECLEAELVDLGPAWPAAARPVHADKAPDARG